MPLGHPWYFTPQKQCDCQDVDTPHTELVKTRHVIGHWVRNPDRTLHFVIDKTWIELIEYSADVE